MSDTVSDILQAIGSYVDQSTTLPTGDELTSRISYIDQAQKEWAGAYDWDVLRRTSPISFVASGTSFGLDQNFMKLESAVYDVVTNTPYEQISPSDRFRKDATEKYVYVLGDKATGKYLTLNPSMTSAVSLQYDWKAYPTSLATLSNIPVCPNTEFLTKRAIAFVLETWSDSRFPQIKADAAVMLRNMIVDQDVGSGGATNTVSDFMTGNYVLGQD